MQQQVELPMSQVVVSLQVPTMLETDTNYSGMKV